MSNEQKLREALQALLASGGEIAEATDDELQAAIDDPDAEEIVKVQAAAVLNARQALAATEQAAPVVPEIDYEALIHAAFAKNAKWAQGTAGCIAFARGAEWFQSQMLAATPAAPSQPVVPVVPEAIEPQDWFESSEQEATETAYCNGWNDCRAAMLAAAPAAPSQPVTLTETRSEFESYFLGSRKSKGANRKPTFERFEDGTYKDDHTQRHWWTWQQAIAALREKEWK